MQGVLSAILAENIIFDVEWIVYTPSGLQYFEKCIITSLAHHWILCSEWVPWWICFLQTCSSSLHKTLTDGLESCELLVDYCHVLLDVRTLILTAPIHCRASTDEQVMWMLHAHLLIYVLDGLRGSEYCFNSTEIIQFIFKYVHLAINKSRKKRLFLIHWVKNEIRWEADLPVALTLVLFLSSHDCAGILKWS